MQNLVFGGVRVDPSRPIKFEHETYRSYEKTTK